MKYTPPLNSTDPDGIFIDGNPAQGKKPSLIPAAVFNEVQQELLNVIKAYNLVPSHDNLSQLAEIFIKIEEKIDVAATASKIIDAFWFAKMYPGPAPEAPTDLDLNYIDFSTPNPTPYKSVLVSEGVYEWQAQDPIVPPDDLDVQILITSRIIDIKEQPNNGGKISWAHLKKSWSPYPMVIDFNSPKFTGIPTTPTPTDESPDDQVANKEFVLGNIGMDNIVERSPKGSNPWYVKYKSGWVEFGGITNVGASTTIPFPFQMNDTNYAISAMSAARGNNDGSIINWKTPLSVSQVVLLNTGNEGAAISGQVKWEVKGYVA